MLGLNGRACDIGDATIRRVKAIYAGQAAEVDHHIGRIVAALRASGMLDNTLVVFTSDHAEQLFDHWMLGKAGYYDQSAHIPLIIRDPRSEARAHRGRIVEKFTEAVDLMPTLLAGGGLEAPRNCDGLNLLPFCTGKNPAGWRDEAH